MKTSRPSVLLINRLREFEQQDAKSGRDFARQLGVSQSQWSRLCAAADSENPDETPEFGIKFFAAIIRRYHMRVMALIWDYFMHEPGLLDRHKRTSKKAA